RRAALEVGVVTEADEQPERRPEPGLQHRHNDALDDADDKAVDQRRQQSGAEAGPRRGALPRNLAHGVLLPPAVAGPVPFKDVARPAGRAGVLAMVTMGREPRAGMPTGNRGRPPAPRLESSSTAAAATPGGRSPWPRRPVPRDWMPARRR